MYKHTHKVYRCPFELDFFEMFTETRGNVFGKSYLVLQSPRLPYVCIRANHATAQRVLRVTIKAGELINITATSNFNYGPRALLCLTRDDRFLSFFSPYSSAQRATATHADSVGRRRACQNPCATRGLVTYSVFYFGLYCAKRKTRNP